MNLMNLYCGTILLYGTTLNIKFSDTRVVMVNLSLCLHDFPQSVFITLSGCVRVFKHI